MTNPSENELLKAYVLNNVREEIIDWISNDYPDIGDKLVKRAEELRLQSLSTQRTYEDFIKLINEYVNGAPKTIADKVKKEINEFLNEKDTVFKELAALRQNGNENLKIFEKMLEEVKHYLSDTSSKCNKSYCEIVNIVSTANQELIGFIDFSKKLQSSHSFISDFYNIKDSLMLLRDDFQKFKKGLLIATSDSPIVPFDKPIKDCEFSIRTERLLSSYGINTSNDLLKWSESDLLKKRSFGKRSLKEVQEFKKKILEIDDD